MTLRLFSNFFSGKAFHGFSLLLLVLFLFPEIKAQTIDSSIFLAKYKTLIESSASGKDDVIEAQVSDLVSINNKERGKYDSLVISMLIWHFNYKTEKITSDERLMLLYEYRKIIKQMASNYPGEVARFYSLFIPVFRFHYQLDSIEYYLDLMAEQLDRTKSPLQVKINWYYEKGRHAYGQGDYEAALTFTKHGLEYLNQNFPDQVRMKILLMNAIGIGYRRIGMFDEAIAWYESILEDNQNEVYAVRMTGALLNNLGLAYKDCGEWDNAIRYMSEAITYYAKTFSPTYEDIGSGYDNMAICYQSKGDVANALRFSEKSLKFIQTNFGPTHPDLLLPMNSMTSTYLQDRKPEAALDMNLKAQALLSQLGWNAKDPGGDYYLADGFDVFAFALDIQRALFDSSSDTAFLQAAIKAGDHFMALTDHAYDHLKNDLSKEIFQAKHGKVFSACIRDVYDLYTITHDRSLIERAFVYSEKFKSLELLYAAQKDKADHVKRFNMLNQEYSLLSDSIRFYEELFYSSENDPVHHAKINSRLTLVKEALYQWKELVKKEHADYYQLIYHPEPVTLNELQTALDQSHQCMISYHLAEDAVYMIVISGEEVHFIKKEFTGDMPSMVSMFRNAVYGYFLDRRMDEANYLDFSRDFVETSTTLYSILLAPVKHVLKDRVVIIVDKTLGYIPFDLLLNTKPQKDLHYKHHKYALLDHAISYSYSARLWMDMQKVTLHVGSEILAIAPYFPESLEDGKRGQLREGLGYLYFNEMEVDNILRIISGKKLIGQQATKQNFIENSSRYDIIHLATHGKANDEKSDYSFLAFTDRGGNDSRLLASEIYSLELEAELVTLSACETGMGKLRSGEGIISLARAFSYAGAHSIVSSLWSVNDKSTSSVMTTFYRYLKEGQPKDVAMQKAKLDFISSVGHADAHPFYWGGFICVGEMSPIEIKNRPVFGFYAGLLAIAALVILIFLQKSRTKLGTSRK